MITSKKVLRLIENNLLDVPLSSSSEEIVNYIKQHLIDIYGVSGTTKEIKLVLEELIAKATDVKIKQKLLRVLNSL